MHSRKSPGANAMRTTGNISCIIGTAFIVAALAFNLLPPELTYADWGSGAIWTTNEPCEGSAQDDNEYAIGETVHIRGMDFDANYVYGWRITGQPGSADPRQIVASGDVTTTSVGYFCVASYTVQPDDDGVYTVDVFDPANPSQSKNDNYHVKGVIPTSTSTSTSTNTATFIPTNTFTNTPTNTATSTPTRTATNTPTSTPVNTATGTFTFTPVPNTSTPTNTSTHTPTSTLTNTPSNTPTSTSTNTAEPATGTPTFTPVPATSTPTSSPTSTPTNTSVPSTITPSTPTNTPQPPTDSPATQTPTLRSATDPATLAPPPGNTPAVLIPVTGINLDAGGFMGDLQLMVINLGLSLLGFGFILKGLARRF